MEIRITPAVFVADRAVVCNFICVWIVRAGRDRYRVVLDNLRFKYALRAHEWNGFPLVNKSCFYYVIWQYIIIFNDFLLQPFEDLLPYGRGTGIFHFL